MLDLFSAQLFLGPAQRRLFKQGLPVFTYHNIADAPPNSRDPFLYVSPTRFEEQLKLLGQRGYTSGSLDDLPGPDGNSGQKVVITFDDGYRNVLKNGLGLLVKHRFRAIQFIVAGLIGATNEWDTKHGEVPESLMDIAEIREWLAAGQEIGSHSLTHRNLTKLNQGQAREQILGSKKKLEDLFGIPLRHFCYPHGKSTQMVRDLVREAGYTTACTTQFGVNTSETNRFALNRIFCLSESEMLGKVRHRLGKKWRGK